MQWPAPNDFARALDIATTDFTRGLEEAAIASELCWTVHGQVLLLPCAQRLDPESLSLSLSLIISSSGTSSSHEGLYTALPSNGLHKSSSNPPRNPIPAS
jgi:hypothetical protein